MVQPPLPGIPEVPFNQKRENRKKKTNKYNTFQEPTIVEEPPFLDAVTSPESPVNNRTTDLDVDSNSQASDLLRSTPRNLSTEDLSSEGDSKDEEIRSPISSSDKKLEEWNNPTSPASSSSNTNTNKFNYPNTQHNSNKNRHNSASEVLSGSEVEMNAEPLTTITTTNTNNRIPTINTPDADQPFKPSSPPPAKQKTPKPVSVQLTFFNAFGIVFIFYYLFSNTVQF